MDARSDIAKARLTIPRTLLIFLGLGLGALYFLSMTFHVVLWAGVFWGLAMYATGVLGGFVFGIPRVLDREADPPPTPPKTSEAPQGETSAERLRSASNGTASVRRRSSINSNLVEVSDWLTKIIVGVGLVELKNLPGHGESLAAFIGLSLIPVSQDSALVGAGVSLSGAIALYFGVLGFITGYLLTRIFLAVVMSLADRDVNAVETPLELPGGQRLPLQDLLEGFRSSISDIQSRVAELIASGPAASQARVPAAGAPAPASSPATSPPSPASAPGTSAPARSSQALAPAASAPPSAAPAGASTLPSSTGAAPPPHGQPVRRLLWVDDSPNRNALLVSRLREAGVIIDQATTTREALALLSRETYGVVVTDVARRGEESPETAGLRFIREMRGQSTQTLNAHVPVVVFCSRSHEARVREEALDSGADFVTSSQVDLWAQFTRYFGPM